MRRVAVALTMVVAIVGLKFYNKAEAHNDVQARLVELCEGDSACQAAVEAHYDACFESTYKMGGRRQASQLDLKALVKCVNSRAGEDYFTVQEDKK